MKHLLLFCLAIAVTALGRDRAAVNPPPPQAATGVRYVSRNLVFGVADTTILSRDPIEEFLRAKAAEGQPLPTFSTAVTETPKAVGTGVIVARAGYVLTAAHVIEGAARIKVVTTEGQLSATPVAWDRGTDLAILKLPEATYPSLGLAPSGTALVGQRVAAIGFPRPDLAHVQPRLLRGKITAAKDEWDNAGHWKLDVATQPGESGAPVIEEQGYVVGIVQRAVAAFPVPLDETMPVVSTIAVKSGYGWPLLEYARPGPATAEPPTTSRSFADVVVRATQATVLVLTYDRAPRPEQPMSPEPAPAQTPWQPPPLLGFGWPAWQLLGLRVWLITLLLTVAAVAVTTVWLTPYTTPGPSLWDIGPLAIGGGTFFLCGHAVLALRVTATESVGRRIMVRAAVELMLAGTAWLAGAGLLWLIVPFGRFDPMMSVPRWLRAADFSIANSMTLIGTCFATDGFIAAARLIYDEWTRLPRPPAGAVPPARSRVPVEQN